MMVFTWTFDGESELDGCWFGSTLRKRTADARPDKDSNLLPFSRQRRRSLPTQLTHANVSDRTLRGVINVIPPFSLIYNFI